LIRDWIQREHPRGNTFNFPDIEIEVVPQQVGYVDCGIHVLSFMLNLARGEEISQETGEIFAQVRRDEFANLLAQAAREAEPAQMELDDWTVVDETQDDSAS
jgi:Ulp1 family protease